MFDLFAVPQRGMPYVQIGLELFYILAVWFLVAASIFFL